MCKKSLIRFSGFVILMAIFFVAACTLNREGGPARPRLVLLIAIDAFRFDYLTRFANNFSDRGFKRILRRGANFTDAHINHFRTATGPGHSTMLTGASGKVSGIVDNEWYDRELATKVIVLKTAPPTCWWHARPKATPAVHQKICWSPQWAMNSNWPQIQKLR